MGDRTKWKTGEMVALSAGRFWDSEKGELEGELQAKEWALGRRNTEKDAACRSLLMKGGPSRKPPRPQQGQSGAAALEPPPDRWPLKSGGHPTTFLSSHRLWRPDTEAVSLLDWG